MIDIPEAEYIVFEHGPFDYEQENRSIEEKIEKAMATFDFADTAYSFDTSPGRIMYLYHNPERFLSISDQCENKETLKKRRFKSSKASLFY